MLESGSQGFRFFLITVFFPCWLLASQAGNGAWFSRMGDEDICHQNPALECEWSNLGPSDLERVMHRQIYSSLDLHQNNVLRVHRDDSEDSSWQLTDWRSSLDFQMWLGVIRSSAIGLKALVPYPNRRWVRKDLKIYDGDERGWASLMLGNDLLGLAPEEGPRNHQLLWQMEIPVAYEYGTWRAALDWVWRPGLRLGIGGYQMKVKRELSSNQQEDSDDALRWNEKGYEMRTAVRWQSLQVGALWSGFSLDSIETPSVVSQWGSGQRASLSIQWISEHLQWKQQGQWYHQDYQRFYDEQKTNDSWSYFWQGADETFRYRTQWTLFPVNVVQVLFWAEKRWWKSSDDTVSVFAGESISDSWLATMEWNELSWGKEQRRISSEGVGFKICWKTRWLDIEPGLAWWRGRQKGRLADPWGTWGLPVENDGKKQYEAWVPSLSLSYRSSANVIRYEWSNPSLKKGEILGWNHSDDLNWGARHHFTLESGF